VILLFFLQIVVFKIILMDYNAFLFLAVICSLIVCMCDACVFLFSSMKFVFVAVV